MKIEKKIILDFLNKIMMNGEVWNGIIDINKDGFFCNSASSNMLVLCNAKISKNIIQDYKEVGKIGVRDFPTLIKYIKVFNNTIDITISKDGSMLIKDEKKEVLTRLADPEFITENDNDIEINVEYKDMFRIKTTQFKKILDYIALFPEKELPVVEFTTDIGVLIIKINHNDDMISERIAVPDIKTKMETPTKFNGILLKNIIQPLSAETISIGLINDTPIKITETFENIMKVSYFLAPRMNDEDSDESDETGN